MQLNNYLNLIVFAETMYQNLVVESQILKAIALFQIYRVAVCIQNIVG